jgi:hypothetical protein
VGLILATAILGLASALLAGELLLRVIFRDGGRTTSLGPGGNEFQYTFAGPDHRAPPVASGPKRDGVTRVMIIGDSITWGHGVLNWMDVYPFRTLNLLNAGGERYELSVFGRVGKELYNHNDTLEATLGGIRPDILVYQWYVNDLERTKEERPRVEFWRKWPGSLALIQHSYLAFFLDNRLGLLRSAGDSYPAYLRRRYAEGTEDWQLFRGDFHRFAVLADGYAERTVLMLYPAITVGGTDAVDDIRRRVAALAQGTADEARAVDLPHDVGVDRPDPGASGGDVRAAVNGETSSGVLVAGPPISRSRGEHHGRFRIRLDEAGPGPLLRLELDSAEGEVLGLRELSAADFGRPGEWQDVDLTFTVPPPFLTRMEPRVVYLGRGSLSIDRLTFPTEYRMEVLDLLPHLQGFNTHASLFDSHPNERAHEAIAHALAAAITAR